MRATNKLKQKATVAGRSFLFNLLFVLFNLTGLTFVVLGSHKNFSDYFILFSFIGYLLMAITAAGLFIFQGRLMMANFARVIVGGVFLVSGLVKLNDPIGFSYKLEEYFEDGALAYRIKELFGSPGFSLEFLIDSALTLSVFLCILEIVLGVLVIIGGKIKLTSYLMVLLMMFFTFLTWHTANCDPQKKFTDRDKYELNDPIASRKIKEAKTNKDIKVVSMDSKEVVIDEKKHPQCVTDCGCFGDAVKGSVGRSLTPHESFWKDLVLFYLILWIFISQWIIEPNDKKRSIKFLIATSLVLSAFSWVFGWYFPILFGLIVIVSALWIRRSGGILLGNFFGATLLVTCICGGTAIYVLMYEPIKDYRPYAVGSNLKKKMKDGQEGKYESVLVYKNVNSGEEIDYLSTSKEYTNSKIWEDKNWKYLRMDQKEIIPTRLPSITDQFNPFVSLNDLGPFEMHMEFVRGTLKKSKIKALRLKKNSTGEIVTAPLKGFDSYNYPTTEFVHLDTIEITDPELTEISIKELILDSEKIFILVSKDLNKANWYQFERYKSIFADCKRNKIPFVLICNGSRTEINSFRKKNKFNVPVFVNDQTELKVIARSNPALIVIQKGVVKAKFPHRSTPTYDWINKNLDK